MRSVIRRNPRRRIRRIKRPLYARLVCDIAPCLADYPVIEVRKALTRLLKDDKLFKLLDDSKEYVKQLRDKGIYL